MNIFCPEILNDTESAAGEHRVEHQQAEKKESEETQQPNLLDF